MDFTHFENKNIFYDAICFFLFFLAKSCIFVTLKPKF